MCRRFIVTGRVQGVFFRDSTRKVAESLHLSGHAINLPDGGVEVRACGPEPEIKRLYEWLQEGPPLARVDRVERVDATCVKPDGFATG